MKGGNNPAEWVFLDLPLYYFLESDAAAFFAEAMDDLQAPLTGIDHFTETISIPGFSLSAPYPNPFNAETSIDFKLPAAGWVTLDLYDIRGRQISNIAKGGFPSGINTVRFYGTTLPSGIFFTLLEYRGNTVVKKIVLLK